MSQTNNLNEAQLVLLEKRRVAVEKNFNFLKTYGLIVAALFAIGLLLWFLNGNYTFAVLVLMIGFIVFYFLHSIYYRKKTIYIREMKEIIAVDELSKSFDRVSFGPHNGLSNTSIEGLGLFDTKNPFASSDLIEGEYRGVGFRRADVKAITKYKNKEGKEQSTTAFLGQLYLFECSNPNESYFLKRDKQFEACERYGKGKLERMSETFVDNLIHDNIRGQFSESFKQGVMSITSKSKQPLAIAVRKRKACVAVYSKKNMLEPDFKENSIKRYRSEINEEVLKIIEFIESLDLVNAIS